MELTLTQLIEVDMLQKVQDAFSQMTGMAALTTDTEGKAVTRGSNFTEYCMEFTRKSPIGCARCEKCDRYGSERIRETGEETTYVCHSGLVDFSAPITADGKLLGCFIGGQVLYEEPDPDNIRRVAQEIGVEFEPYWAAIKKIPVIPKERIDAAAHSLHMFADVLSALAYSKYATMEAAKEIERAANMKSDFLANMSHEIRTPMNAVIGMAEMALRENLSVEARNYITQIKSSGRSLLNIINDILDFSKIESGKMDIVDSEYEPLSLYNDIASIVETRIGDKRVELLMDVNPTFPRKLCGDSQRVRQILINLANNAVKFTQRGSVTIKIDYDKIDDDYINVKVWVKDTGCGIKQEDLVKIFESFQQVDSKRNRNIEGTGLGLAISRNLLKLMNGSIKVESEYEKGSTFYFEVPQKVVDWQPSIVANDADKVIAMGYFRNKYLAKQFYRDANRLGIYSIAIISPDKFGETLRLYNEQCKEKKIFVFTEEICVDAMIRTYPKQYDNITVVELVGFKSDRRSTESNWRILRKPLSAGSIAMALNGEEYQGTQEDSDAAEFDFTAPEAKILIVDDNSINLTVAEGLLEPLNMKIYAVTSGQDALEQVEKEHFDIIFMDHMMPGLDGVETTRLIRRMHPECNDTAIIALTANVVEGTKDMFLSEGMNDFVAKPIEVRTIVQKVKTWLPIEKINKGRKLVEYNSDGSRLDEEIVIGDLDTYAARKLAGSDRLFFSILKEFYKAIPIKTRLIATHKHNEDWPAYTIEVHALKSASKQIGANRLSDLAADLEKAGNARDIAMIREETDGLIEMYLGLQPILAPFCEEKKEAEEAKIELDKTKVGELLTQMEEALENLDMDGMESTVKELKKYRFDSEGEELVGKLAKAADGLDLDTCAEIVENMKERLL